MKVWDVIISGHDGTKYHKAILLKDFQKFITQLKAKAFSDKGIEMGFTKLVDELIEDVNVLSDEMEKKNNGICR